MTFDEKIRVVSPANAQSILDAKKGEIDANIAAGRPSLFKMTAPLPALGRDSFFLAATDRINIFLKTYAVGDTGEIELHTHANEDHTFIVLQGSARFGDEKGNEFDLTTHEGILLPRGAFYKFFVTSDEPLVMIRIGSIVDPTKVRNTRVNERSQNFPGNSQQNSVAVAYLPNAHFV
jgi:mannose-6-phosphate isomerase-like protein (cupin superfamily)